MNITDMKTDDEYKVITNVPYGLKGNVLVGLVYYGKVGAKIAATHADIRGIYQEHIRDTGTNIDDYDFLLFKDANDWYAVMETTIVDVSPTASEIHIVVSNGGTADIPKITMALKKLGLESTITSR